MSLEPEVSTPGLWINKEWEENKPGTFAVIIGVSIYDHLAGGTSPVKDTYGLGQLYVSALTAYRFFCWLRDKYQYSNSPLANCWLLLSPRKDEILAEPTIEKHTLPPTFENCENAILKWYQSMARLPSQNTKQSRLFFFFSGHGIEITREKQILLPCDYLKNGNVNKALSTSNIVSGLADLNVADHFFFIDACRNDHQKLREREVEGHRVLNPSPAYSTNPERNAAIIYASSSGTQAFQPRDTTVESSLFGQALLEGLEALGPIDFERNVTPCSIQIAPLHTYLNKRVPRLIKERGAQVRQTIPLSGSILNLYTTVTQMLEAPEEFPIKFGSRPSDSIFLTHIPLNQWNPVLPPQDGPSSIEVFGDENMSRIWSEVRVYSLKRREWLDVATHCKILQVDRAGTSYYKIKLNIIGNLGSHWLELSDNNLIFACLLPDDQPRDDSLRECPTYLLELDQEDEQDNRQLTRLAASLAADDDSSLLSEVAKLWEQYTNEDVAKVAYSLNMQVAQVEVFEKAESPLVATILSIILLRTRRQDISQDWLHNLVQWFPDNPDVPILWLECLLQKTGQRPLLPNEEITDQLLELEKRGLPQTCETFGYAIKQVEELLECAQLNESQREILKPLHLKLRKALQFFRNGGLFSVFVGRKGALTPNLVIGNFNR